MTWLGELGALLLVLGLGAVLATGVFHGSGGIANEDERGMIVGLYVGSTLAGLLGGALFLIWYVAVR